MDHTALLARVRWQRQIAHEVLNGAVKVRARFEQQRSAVWATRARSAGLRQRAELVRLQSVASRLGLSRDAASPADRDFGMGL